MKIENDTLTIKTEMTQQEYNIKMGRILAVGHNSNGNDWISKEYKRLIGLKDYIKK